MVFTKKNIAIVVAIMQIVFSSFAMDQSEFAKYNLRQLYDELVEMTSAQRAIFPFKQESAITQKSGIVGQDAQRNVFQQTIFDPAKKSGLKAKYNELLAGSSSELQRFCGPLQLVAAAYMQNTYGNGNPAVYRERMDLSFDEYKPYNYPILGVYNKAKITRYNFVYSLLTEADKILANPAIKITRRLGENLAMLRANLLEAIEYVSNPTGYKQDTKPRLLSGSGY